MPAHGAGAGRAGSRRAPDTRVGAWGGVPTAIPHACQLAQPRRTGHEWEQRCAARVMRSSTAAIQCHAWARPPRVDTPPPPCPALTDGPGPRGGAAATPPGAAPPDSADVTVRGGQARGRCQWEGAVWPRGEGGGTRVTAGARGHAGKSRGERQGRRGITHTLPRASAVGMRRHSLGRHQVGTRVELKDRSSPPLPPRPPPQTEPSTSRTHPHRRVGLSPMTFPIVTTPSPAHGCLYCPCSRQ